MVHGPTLPVYSWLTFAPQTIPTCFHKPFELVCFDRFWHNCAHVSYFAQHTLLQFMIHLGYCFAVQALTVDMSCQWGKHWALLPLWNPHWEMYIWMEIFMMHRYDTSSVSKLCCRFLSAMHPLALCSLSRLRSDFSKRSRSAILHCKSLCVTPYGDFRLWTLPFYMVPTARNS